MLSRGRAEGQPFDPIGNRTNRDRGTAGFTLIEVLVALSVVAIALAAIGSVIATSVRGTRSLAEKLTTVATARAIMTALPDRGALKPGSLSGEMAGQAWRVDVRPMAVPQIDPQLPTPWIPHRVTIRLQSPSGAILELETVRLRLREGG